MFITRYSPLSICLLVALGTFFVVPRTSAQIIPDNTLPNNSVVVSGCTACTIEGGTMRGVNLYHSFVEFSVPTNGTAYFNNPTSIENILTRVTGSNLSRINGLIRTNGITNLFLMNSNGIIFGPNARLDIGGTFVATTASSFKFLDGSEFNATNSQALPLLTVSITPGLQYGASQPGATITSQGNLQTGQDLQLIADRLDLQGQLIAGRNLTLQATDTIKIRDTVTSPFLAQSIGNLTIQGNQGIDILTLNHSEQFPFTSGGNLTLVSDGTISGDAHFSSGGTFQVRSLSGQLAYFTSLYDPIISSVGDIDFTGNYSGPALLVESKGNVRFQGSINITGPDTTLNPNDPNPDKALLANSAALIIRSGLTDLLFSSATTLPGSSNGATSQTGSNLPAGISLAGPVTTVNGPVTLIANNGAITFHLINTASMAGNNGGNIDLMASGTIENKGSFSGDSFGFGPQLALGSFSGSTTGNSGNGGRITATSLKGDIVLTGGAASGSITQASGRSGNGGDIVMTANSGSISLVSSLARKPHLNASSFAPVGSASGGGNISLSASSGITLTNIVMFSNSQGFSSEQGGDIVLSANSGDISLTEVELNAYSGATEKSARSGNVLLSTNSGNISLTRSIVSASSFTPSFEVEGNAGPGGNILLLTNSGDISLRNNTSLFAHSEAFSGNADRGGNIVIASNAGSILGSDTSFLFSYAVARASSKTSGQGGPVTLMAKNQISDLQILTQSSSAAAGAVRINGTGDLVLTNLRIITSQEGIIINTNIPNQPIVFPAGTFGSSGDVTVRGEGNLIFNGSVLNSNTTGKNPAGNILITSPGTVTLQHNTQILSNTSNSGSAGSITVSANQGITIADNSQITAQTSGPGQAGNIVINTLSLMLADDARITATATATSTNQQGGGSITLNASRMNLAGTVGVFAETQGQSPAGTLRLNPYNHQPDLLITLAPNAQISASTSGRGDGGDLVLAAPQSITLSGAGTLAVEAKESSSGNAGNITFTTRDLTLTNGVTVSAATSGRGRAGSINVEADRLTLNQGARISSATSGMGTAGNIALFLNSALILDNASIQATTASGSTGAGGNIFIDPEVVNLRHGSLIATDSQGRGTGGNITLIANHLLLNDSILSAATNNNDGGNITLNLRDYLLLRNGSKISATAGGSGNGGILDIDSTFILAVNREDNDLIARASQGRGGQIRIKTQDLFGLEYRDFLSPLSDINASSDFGISGTVTITTPGLDPSRGLAALPINLTDSSRQIAQGCSSSTVARKEGRFVVLGRGGLPESPEDLLNSQLDLEDLGRTVENQSTNTRSRSIALTLPEQIVEIQGWVKNEQGEIFLVANSSTPLLHNPVKPRLSCL